MDKEEFLDKLQLCYFGDKSAFEEIVGVYDDLQQRIEKANKYIYNCMDELLPACPTWITDLLDILKGDSDEESEEQI